MALNSDKTVTMCLTRKKKDILEFRYSVNGVDLQRVTEYKYLGIILASDLSWNAHVKYITNKALPKTILSEENVKVFNS